MDVLNIDKEKFFAMLAELFQVERAGTFQLLKISSSLGKTKLNLRDQSTRRNKTALLVLSNYFELALSNDETDPFGIFLKLQLQLAVSLVIIETLSHRNGSVGWDLQELIVGSSIVFYGQQGQMSW